MKIYLSTHSANFQEIHSEIKRQFSFLNSELMQNLKIQLPEFYNRIIKRHAGLIALYDAKQEGGHYYFDFRTHNTPGVFQGARSFSELTPSEKTQFLPFIVSFLKDKFHIIATTEPMSRNNAANPLTNNNNNQPEPSLTIEEIIEFFKKTMISNLNSVTNNNGNRLFNKHYRVEKINGTLCLRESNSQPPHTNVKNRVNEILAKLLSENEYLYKELPILTARGSDTIKGYFLTEAGLNALNSTTPVAAPFQANNNNNNNQPQHSNIDVETVFKQKIIDILNRNGLDGLTIFKTHYRFHQQNNIWQLRESSTNPPPEIIQLTMNSILPDILGNEGFHRTRAFYSTGDYHNIFKLTANGLNALKPSTNQHAYVPVIQPPQRVPSSPSVFFNNKASQPLKCPADATPKIKEYWSELPLDVKKLVILSCEKHIAERINANYETPTINRRLETIRVGERYNCAITLSKCSIPVQLNPNLNLPEDADVNKLVDLEEALKLISNGNGKHPFTREPFSIGNIVARENILLQLDKELPTFPQAHP